MQNSQYWYFSQFGAAKEQFQQGTTPLPALEEGQALIAIRAIGVNRADKRYTLGKHFPPKSLPSCIAQEAVGEIIALGKNTSASTTLYEWKIGDRVALTPMLVDTQKMGVLRDYGIYDQSILLPVPDIFTDQEAAAYWMGVLTMAGAMNMAGLTPSNSAGKTIVITAATGGVGIIGLKLAKAWGMESIATTRSPQKSLLLKQLASSIIITDSASDYSQQLKRKYPKGVNIVIDPLGGDYVNASIENMDSGGQYVGYEMVTNVNANYNISRLLATHASIHGYTVFHPVKKAEIMRRLVKIGMEYAEKLRPIIAQNYTFNTAPDAFDAIEKGEHFGKIVITI